VYGTCGTQGAGVRCLQGLVRKPEGKKQLEDLGVGERITLRWTLERQGWMRRTGFGWLRIGSSGGLL
jgi:hypothetical protein